MEYLLNKVSLAKIVAYWNRIPVERKDVDNIKVKKTQEGQKRELLKFANDIGRDVTGGRGKIIRKSKSLK